MKTNLIYRNSGVRVEVRGTIIVRLPDGREIARYPVERVEDAINFADELAERSELAA
jgi:hypothetical protein